MACYSDNCKSRSQKCVTFVGVILIIMGILTAVFGFVLSGDEDVKALLESEWMKNLKIDGADATSGFSTAIIACGVFVILTGVLGILTGKCMKPCFTLPFMILSGIIGLILVVVGAISLIVLSDKVELKKTFCDTKSEYLGGKSIGEIFPDQYNALVDSWMCTPQEIGSIKGCPCPASSTEVWTAVEESSYTPHGRTKSQYNQLSAA